MTINSKAAFFNTVFGVLLMQVLKTGLTQVGISSIYQQAIIGSVVLTAIIMDALFKGSFIQKLSFGGIPVAARGRQPGQKGRKRERRAK